MKIIRLIREMYRSQLKAPPQQQASGPLVTHRPTATPALAEGDADAAGKRALGTYSLFG